MIFKSVIDQKAVIKNLTLLADKDHLPNSFLFYGPEGVGKWSMALALTSYLNCRYKVNNDSCGSCPTCKQIDHLQFPNLFLAVPTPPSKKDEEETDNYWDILNRKIERPYSLITGQRQMSIPVEAIRRMKKDLAQTPPTAGTRVVIIEQMDRMLTSSADALLKIIEEPPSRTLVIITTSRPEKILPTIISRCRRIRFSHLSEQTITRRLIDDYKITDKSALLLARLSSGSLGRALYLADDENRQDREIAKLIMKGIFLESPEKVIAEAIELLPLRDRFRLNRVIAAWQTIARDIILIQTGAGEEAVINIDFFDDLRKFSARPVNPGQILKLPQYLGSVRADIDLNVDTRSAVAAAIIEMSKILRHDKKLS